MLQTAQQGEVQVLSSKCLVVNGIVCLKSNFLGTSSQTGGTSYTTLYNILNFPAGSMPVTKVSAQDEEDLQLHYHPKKYHERVLQKVLLTIYFHLSVEDQCHLNSMPACNILAHILVFHH